MTIWVEQNILFTYLNNHLNYSERTRRTWSVSNTVNGFCCGAVVAAAGDLGRAAGVPRLRVAGRRARVVRQPGALAVRGHRAPEHTLRLALRPRALQKGKYAILC